jgi:glutaredoxin 3
VPNVFIGGNHIGGCDSMPSYSFSIFRYLFTLLFTGGLLLLFPETTGMHQEGKLVPLLADAGAVASASASA